MIVVTTNRSRAEVLKALVLFALKSKNMLTNPANAALNLSTLIRIELETLEEEYSLLPTVPYKFDYLDAANDASEEIKVTLNVDLTNSDAFDATGYDAIYGEGSAQLALNLYTLDAGIPLNPMVFFTKAKSKPTPPARKIYAQEDPDLAIKEDCLLLRGDSYSNSSESTSAYTTSDQEYSPKLGL